jgi:hypothetical protein
VRRPHWCSCPEELKRKACFRTRVSGSQLQLASHLSQCSGSAVHHYSGWCYGKGPESSVLGRTKAEASLAFTSPPSHAAITGRRTPSMLQVIRAPIARMRRTAHVYLRHCHSCHIVPLRARAEETQGLMSGPPGQSVLHDWGWRERVQIVRCALLLSKDNMRQ